MSTPLLTIRLLGLILSVSFAGNCFAIVEIIPPYSISPALNNLNIAYFVKQDKIKITLYAVNHETFPVVCDAEYQGGPDTESAHEQTIMPEKAIEFAFSYPKKVDNVLLQFVCIKKIENIKPDTIKSSESSTTPESINSQPLTMEASHADSIIEIDITPPQ